MKKEDSPAEPRDLSREGSLFARPRALFVLLLLTSFLALALWAVEMRPSVATAARPEPIEGVAAK
jgi:hypothetical protein